MKAQITVFIIIGLILMLSLALVLYTVRERFPPAKETLFVPTEAKPLHDFVTECIHLTAKNTLERLGTQAGYITIPSTIQKNPYSYLPLEPTGTFITPFWYYEGEDRSPNLQRMEQEMNTYITHELKACTRDFASFQELTITEQGNISTKTTITEDDIAIKVTWPLRITLAETTTQTKDYVVNEPVRLKKIWETAQAIMRAENTGNFFENLTLDWMTANPEIPFDGFEFSCTPKTWTIPAIKQETQSMLATNLPYIRVENTKYPAFQGSPANYRELASARQRMLKNFETGQAIEEQKIPEAPEDAYEYFKMTMKAQAPASNLATAFTYQPNWGMSLSAQPNNGQKLITNTAKSTGSILRMLCINQWHFTYDVIYPVRVTIRDDEAYQNTGYQFSFAFPVLIDNNAPDRITFGHQQFQEIPLTREFCDEPGNTLVDLRAKGLIEGTIIATELDNTTMTYTCFTESCDLGTTRADQGIYRLRTYLPKGCTNPFITATKQGYAPQTKPLVENTLTLELQKLTTLNTSIVIHPYYVPERRFLTQQETLGKQQATIHIVSRVRYSSHEKQFPHEQALTLPSNKTTLDLLPGTYEIDTLLTRAENTVGGYHNNKFTISPEELAGKTTLEIHVVEFRPAPRTDQEKLDMMAYLFTNEDYQKELHPKIL